MNVKSIPLLLISVIIWLIFRTAPAWAAVNEPGHAEELTDPHRIMLNYYNAVGGLEKLKSETSVYYEAVHSSAGLKGSIRYWSAPGGQWRQETRMMNICDVKGCSGSFYWDVDRNHKIKIQKHDVQKTQIRLERYLKSYRHMEPGSPFFTFSLGEPIKIDQVDCYTVNLSNTLTSHTNRYYINRKTFMLEKSVEFTSEGAVYTRYRNYRLYKNIRRPLRCEFTVMPSGGKYTRKITRMLINPQISASKFIPPARDVRDFHFISGDRAEEIPFKLYGDHIFVPLEINGKKQHWLLDTGANATVIDFHYAQSLGIVPLGKYKGRGAHYSFYYSYVKGPGIRLKGLEIDPQLIVTLELGSNYNGILGYDFLSRFVTRIDYRRKRISFYDPEKFRYNGSGKPIDARLLGKDITVPITVDGTLTGRWRVDLGATFTAFHFPYASENGLLRRKGEIKFSQGIGGTSKMKMVTFHTMTIGSHTIGNPKIAVPIQPTGGAFSFNSLAGNLGNSVFRNFTLYLDYTRQILIVERTRR